MTDKESSPEKDQQEDTLLKEMAELCEMTEDDFLAQTDEEFIVQEMKMGDEIPKKKKKTSEEEAGNVSLLYAIINAKTRKPKLIDNRYPIDLTTVVIGSIKEDNDSICRKNKLVKMMIDIGCSTSIIKRNVIPENMLKEFKNRKETTWATNAGHFTTRYECKIQFRLPEFSSSREIT